MRKLKFKSTIALIVVLAVSLCLVGVTAYFTDRVEANATVQTVQHGVDIEPKVDPDVVPDDPSNPAPNPENDLSSIWMYLNGKTKLNFNPGDKMTLSYILENKGTLGVDIRETFIVTSSVAMTDGTPEFQLFSSVGAGTYGGFKGTALTAPTGATATTTRLSATQYKYVIQYYSLSGSDETVGTNPKQLGREYYLVFSETAGNAFQGATCTVDYVVEAKQHTDGGDADWTTAATGSLTVGGQTLKVVPEA